MRVCAICAVPYLVTMPLVKPTATSTVLVPFDGAAAVIGTFEAVAGALRATTSAAMADGISTSVSSASRSRSPSSSLPGLTCISHALPSRMVKRSGCASRWSMRPNTALAPKVMMASRPSAVLPTHDQLPSMPSSWRA